MEYYQEMHYLCMKSAFSQFMDLMGIEDNLLYLKVGNEIKIKMNNERIGIYKHFSLMPFHNMEKIESGKGGSFEEVFEDNVKKLPLVVLCDVFYLPFRKEHLKHHATHAIIFKGYNVSEKSVHIIDWYAPHFFDGEISLDEFKKARNSENIKDANMFSGYRVENYWYKINDKSDLLTIQENYDRNVLEMLKNEDKPEKGIYRGINAITAAKDNFKNVVEGLELDIKANMSIYHDEFFVFNRTMLFGSFYYQKYYEKFNSDSALKYMKFCKNNAAALEKMNRLFLKASMRTTQNQINTITILFEQLEKSYSEIN